MIKYIETQWSKKPVAIFRPEWVEPEAMEKIGYYLISDKDGYLKYQNDNTGKAVSPGYGRMWKDKRIIYFNCEYKPEQSVVYVGIEEDGGTRNVYGGVCDSAEFLNKLLESVR